MVARDCVRAMHNGNWDRAVDLLLEGVKTKPHSLAARAIHVTDLVHVRYGDQGLDMALRLMTRLRDPQC